MDMIVDLIVGHEMLSLIDGFFGYNQIKIIEEDQHNITFTTPWGKLCYQVVGSVQNLPLAYVFCFLSGFGR